MSSNTLHCRDSGAVSLASELLSVHVLPWLQGTQLSASEEDGVRSGVIVLAKTCLQLLGNVCVRHELGQKAVWQLCFPALFQ